jgi:tRNA A37 threonylcarbamoyladenosine biosynthesis protein TsaE
MKNTVFILRGLPGAGKSEFAFDLFEEMGSTFTHCSADNYMTDEFGEYHFDAANLPRAHHLCKRDFKIALEENINCIVVDNTNVKVWEFQPYIDAARIAGYTVKVLVVENHHNGRSIHGVPADKMEQMAKDFVHCIKPGLGFDLSPPALLNVDLQNLVSPVYISGPITGIDDGNKAEFDKMAKHLESFGFEAVNPRRNPIPEGTTLGAEDFWNVMMQESLKIMMECNSIVLLEGWGNSVGAVVERDLALTLDWPIVDLENI